LLKYIPVVLLFLGLSSCKSKDEKANLIEEQIIGTWISSECITFREPYENNKSINLQYTFSDDAVIDTLNYYIDANCNNLNYSEDSTSPLIKNGIFKSDTGEYVFHLEWVYHYESGDVKETNLSVYVEGSNLYFGNINLEDKNTPSTIRFDEPFYKLENQI